MQNGSITGSPLYIKVTSEYVTSNLSATWFLIHSKVRPDWNYRRVKSLYTYSLVECDVLTLNREDQFDVFATILFLELHVSGLLSLAVLGSKVKSSFGIH